MTTTHMTDASALKLRVEHIDDSTLLTLVPPDSGTLPQKAILAYMDVSYSMNAAATAAATNDDGSVRRDASGRVVDENKGWSMLDLAKHALITIVRAMKDEDVFSLVSYSDTARVRVDWTAMDSQGKTQAEACIRNVGLESSTNFMAALNAGKDQMLKLRSLDGWGERVSNAYVAQLFLTDGKPTHEMSPGFYGRMVNEHRDAIGFSYAMHTLGIGDVNSQLLSEMGDMLHIPGPESIGTFVCSLIGAMNSVCQIDGHSLTDVCITLLRGGQPLTKTKGDLLYCVSDNTADIQMGSVLYGIARPVAVLRGHSIPSSLTCSLGGFAIPIQFVPSQPICPTMHFRVMSALAQFNVALMRELAREAEGCDSETCHTLTTQVIPGLADGIARQKWGEHYARALHTGISRGRRTNFRDKMLFRFTSAAFDAQVNAAEMIFSHTPAPTPSLLPRTAGLAVPATAPPRILPEEYMRGGGCMLRGTPVCLSDSSTIPIEALMKGMEIMTPHGTTHVECVVHTMLPENSQITFVAGIGFTPTHPYREVNETIWRRPLSSNATETMPEQIDVYNVVTDEEADGTRQCLVLYADRPLIACGLGHGLNEDVVQHEYYGTSAVVQDLRTMESYPSGFVVINQRPMTQSFIAETTSPLLVN